MSYVVIWLQACLHWRCAYFQTLSWSDTIFVVDWNILYKLCGSANKWSKGFFFSGKIWWQFFSCNKACSKYHTRSATTPKYTLTQRLVCQCTLLIVAFENARVYNQKHTLNFICFQCSLKGWGKVASFGRLSKGTVIRSPSYSSRLLLFYVKPKIRSYISEGSRWQIFCQLTQVWPWSSIHVRPTITPATSEILSCVRQPQHLF